VPRSASILWTNFTPQGSILPARVDWLRPSKSAFVFFGLPTDGPGPEPSEIDLACLSLWVDGTADLALQQLASAADLYVNEPTSPAVVIPMNVAIERTVYALMDRWLEPTTGKDRRRDFLETRATYSHQLNVLLPALASELTVPPLPDHIRGNLNQLRGARNDLAHSGFLNPMPTREQIGQWFVSAVFAVAYLGLLREYLITSRSATQKT
jgi:hypothetical protein